MFELVVAAVRTAEVILLRGEIDIYSAPDFKDSLFQAMGIAVRILFWIAPS